MTRFFLAFFATALMLCSTSALATTTYEGSAGVKAQVFESSEGHCTDCHVENEPIPALDNYDSAKAEIVDIIDRINREPTGDDELMPRFGPKLTQTLLDLMDNWDNDGEPEASAPILKITGHSSLTAGSASLEGTLNENGVETMAYFKYWSGAIAPTTCPESNSIAEGCTTTASPAGSGGNDVDNPFVSTATGLNCSTTYSFRAMSNGNNRFGTPISTGTLSFTTQFELNSDADNLCDNIDNCPLDANPLQEDADNDGIGDACETVDSLCFPIKSAGGSVSIICL